MYIGACPLFYSRAINRPLRWWYKTHTIRRLITLLGLDVATDQGVKGKIKERVIRELDPEKIACAGLAFAVVRHPDAVGNCGMIGVVGLGSSSKLTGCAAEGAYPNTFRPCPAKGGGGAAWGCPLALATVFQCPPEVPFLPPPA